MASLAARVHHEPVCMSSCSRSNHGASGEDNGAGCKTMAFLDDEHPKTRGPHIVSSYSLGDLVCKVHDNP
jgi:hypothetical protein